MQSTILKYKEKIPSETRTILDALAEPTRQALVMMLAEKNDVSFRELSRSTQPMNPEHAESPPQSAHQRGPRGESLQEDRGQPRLLILHANGSRKRVPEANRSALTTGPDRALLLL